MEKSKSNAGVQLVTPAEVRQAYEARVASIACQFSVTVNQRLMGKVPGTAIKVVGSDELRQCPPALSVVANGLRALGWSVTVETTGNEAALVINEAERP